MSGVAELGSCAPFLWMAIPGLVIPWGASCSSLYVVAPLELGLLLRARSPHISADEGAT